MRKSSQDDLLTIERGSAVAKHLASQAAVPFAPDLFQLCPAGRLKPNFGVTAHLPFRRVVHVRPGWSFASQ